MKTPKIKKLPSGSYHAQVQVGGRRVSVTADSKKDVEREIFRLKIEKPSTAKIRREMTLYEGIQDYIATKNNILSPATVRGYESMARNRFKNYMHKKLTSIDIQKMLNDEAALVAPKTLKNAWGLVAPVLKRNRITYDPVLLPVVIEEERNYLQPAELPVFLEAIKGHKYEIAYLTCLHGLRASEMLALDKSDITNVIRVNKAIVPGPDQKLILKHMAKNEKSMRDVPIIIQRLSDLAKDAPNGRLVTNGTNALNRQLKNVCMASGLPIITLHELRHSFVTLMYHLKISEKQAMEFGGYADIITMRKIYTHLAEEDRKRAVDSMTSFFA